MFNLENVLVVVDPYAANDHVLQRVRYLQRMDDFDVHLVSADYTQYLVEGYYSNSVELERLRREFSMSAKRRSSKSRRRSAPWGFGSRPRRTGDIPRIGSSWMPSATPRPTL